MDVVGLQGSVFFAACLALKVSTVGGHANTTPPPSEVLEWPSVVILRLATSGGRGSIVARLEGRGTACRGSWGLLGTEGGWADGSLQGVHP